MDRELEAKKNRVWCWCIQVEKKRINPCDRKSQKAANLLKKAGCRRAKNLIALKISPKKMGERKLSPRASRGNTC